MCLSSQLFFCFLQSKMITKKKKFPQLLEKAWDYSNTVIIGNLNYIKNLTRLLIIKILFDPLWLKAVCVI